MPGVKSPVCSKETIELVKDMIREANTPIPMDKCAYEKMNSDIIKHLIKRLATHQVILSDRAKKTNYWLIVLSIIMAIGSISSVLTFLYSFIL